MAPKTAAERSKIYRNRKKAPSDKFKKKVERIRRFSTCVAGTKKVKHREKLTLRGRETCAKLEAAGVKAEASRVKALAAHVKPEAARVKPEAARVKAQAVHVKPAAARVKAEAARVKTKAAAVKPKAARVKPEAARVKTEAARVKTKAACVKPKAARVKPEAARVKTEAARVKTEAARVKTKAVRVKTKAAAVKTEAARVKTKAARVKPETARVKPEAARVKTKAASVKPEAARVKTKAASVKPEAVHVKAKAGLFLPNKAEGKTGSSSGNPALQPQGVSRSGRVRKRSSKLADFKLLDEIDACLNRRYERPCKLRKIMDIKPPTDADDNVSDNFADDNYIEVKDEPLEMEDEADYVNGSSIYDDCKAKLYTSDPLFVDMNTVGEPEDSNYIVNLKRMACLLWAKEGGLFQRNPDMDLVTVNKKLNKLWAALPQHEKANWIIRANDVLGSGVRNITVMDFVTLGTQVMGSVIANHEALDSVITGSDAAGSVISASDTVRSVICANDAVGSVISTNDAVDSVISPNDALSSIISANDAVSSVVSSNDALSSIISANDAVSSVVSSNDALSSIISANDAVSSAISTRDVVRPLITEKDATVSVISANDAVGSAISAKNSGFAFSTGITKQQTETVVHSNFIKKENERPLQVIVTSSIRRPTEERPQISPPESADEDVTVLETKVEEEVRDEAGNIGTDIQREGCLEAETSSCLMAPTIIRKEISIFLKKTGANQEVRDEAGNIGTDIQREACLEAETSSIKKEIGIFLDKTGPKENMMALHKSECFRKKLLKVMKEIFNKMKNKNIESCPRVLEVALETLLSHKMSLDQVSKFFCISISRLERNLMLLAKVILSQNMCVFSEAVFHDVTDDDRFFEWMLRMRRMGRLPIMTDMFYIKEYLNLSYFPVGIMDFLEMFGEKVVDFIKKSPVTSNDIKIWKSVLTKCLLGHYGIIAKNFLVRRNSPRIFNCVQMYLSHTHVSNQVVSFRGSKNMYSFVSPRQKGVSVMVTFSAAGFYLKPLFMHKNYDMPLWSYQEFVDQSQFHIGATVDGHLDPLLFVTWLRLFNAELLENNIEKPVLLFLHGHPCHASLAATTFCQEENIILFSHCHSPLNTMDPFLGIVDKFHFFYDRSLNNFRNYVGKDNLTLKFFPVIFFDAWNKIKEGDLAIEAFEKSGLVPFDMSVVHENINHDHVYSLSSTSVSDSPFLGKWVTCLQSSTKTLEFASQIQLPYKRQQPVVSEPHVSVNEPSADKASNDPLQVSFEPLLQNSLDNNSFVHVYRKCMQDEEMIANTASNGISEELMEQVEIMDEIDTVKSQETVDSSSCSQLVAPPRDGSVTRWTAGQSSCKFYDQTTSQEMLPGQSYESLGLYDVKIESCKIESPKSDDIEFPIVYIASDSPVDDYLSSKP
ncbi:uncharacterized protein [Cherax quadricarinatus]|uniref:uncharacterized protein isoform X2 n=1 Tax=Cherax quadricarinatus TaxID=27406 RepID=UPI00387E42C4